MIALTVIAVIACIPLLPDPAGSGRAGGVTGAGSAESRFRLRPAGAEDPADHGQE